MNAMNDLQARIRKGKRRRNICIVIFVIMALSVAFFTFNSASNKRFRKTWWSDISGGLDRTVTVYDYNGSVIKQYEGKFDIKESETKVMFDDENGKRVNIYNAVVIVEEN